MTNQTSIVQELRKKALLVRFGTFGGSTKVVVSVMNEAADEIERLTNLINTPELNDFPKAVLIEAVHQRERWGEDHDKSKSVSDWLRLFTHLNAKIGKADWDNDIDKVKHHVITLAAVANNFHAEILRREELQNV